MKVGVRVGRFGNHIVERDGFIFDSKAEADDWTMLQLRERAGEIELLRRQVSFELQPSFTDNEGKRQRAITWTVDFTYVENGRKVAHDTKGFATHEFKMRLKIFRYRYPEYRVLIHEVAKRRGLR